ncbi:bifunctional [glutamine synthetase] adenylyltransferase/[glutamine synthetase]-adenylyl-L-tyrosine phosphorylase [Sphingosinicella terrae]|uniref:bifunctional [glutamine synthetase] adenylyltransferase/[glutamine synthetase]-adenylyl-L-tyrosine phosphorylase n=1 Tax=Sphingosinicella terrae TaxID=2172047 RepID=UPI000E0D4D0F|nr:bifunctional [glutamine synthetase] adenylyltransferase/[glutamine synthetase]-adenylyl-L-tyrosine phosphorylase [Sphingosinicella terrae]
MKETPSGRAIEAALTRASVHSPFLRLQIERFPVIVERLASGDLDGALAAARQQGEDRETMSAVRAERSGFALALAIGDLAGLLPLERVTAELSDLADRTIARSLAQAKAERAPDAEPEGFAVIALGKLGGHELNYSSDVDLILLYDPLRLPRRPREEADQAAVRIAHRLVELLQKRTEDGYAFRVDLRLRPSPEVTPIALPVDAAISYYEAAALPWERAAFIRARMAAGDARLGRYFLDSLHPFVWRRSLDFGAIGEIQSITRRIRDHYAQGQGLGPGFDLKRGRGGIREVEFFVQIHQLIHGGREPELRSPATLDALSALCRAGRIGAPEAAALGDAYRLLRTIEHRLQMVEDRQTHELPRNPEALDTVARLHGLADGEGLVDLIEPHVREVAELYGTLGGDEANRLPLEPAGLEASLADAGFADPAAAAVRVAAWRSGRIRSLRTPAARDAFEAMLPSLIHAFAEAPDPMRAINRFEDVIERLPSGINLYRLLEARPALTQHVAAILSHAPVLADQLGRRPELLDSLIDASAFESAGAVEMLASDMARADRAGDDYQLLLDRVRRQVNERRFALGVQLVVGHGDPLQVAEGYSRVAEAAIEVLAGATVREFERPHGRVPGSELLVLGLGRLGGGALTFASDLDLIYLFSGTHEAESDGLRPLRATDYFNRLAPRVTAALSVPTAAGPLYDVDMRLRPNGQDGLLAVSLETFDRYQREQAWTWEHMALLRARPVFGSAGARAQLQQVVEETLRRPRDPARVRIEAGRMRADIAAHKPPHGPFDIKHGDGGLIDLEFAMHSLQLSHRVGLTPHLGNALDHLIEAGLVPAAVLPAYRLLTRMLVMFRLVSPSSAEPPAATRPLVAKACGQRDWDELLAAHERARQTISDLWRTFSQT